MPTLETRPQTTGLADDQVFLALAHWYLWLLCERGHEREVEWKPAMLRLERTMQPVTLLRLSQARRRYRACVS